MGMGGGVGLRLAVAAVQQAVSAIKGDYSNSFQILTNNNYLTLVLAIRRQK